MKKLFTVILCACFCYFNAQDKYLTKTGAITFEASLPTFEEVKAKNETTTAILNTKNGEFAALALVKGFRFKNALMEEHFNENYAESEKYPKAIFKGIIKDFDLNNLKSNYTYLGELTFHGQKKSLKNEILNLTFKDDKITISGSFIVSVNDFKIDIPKIVKNKVSENVKVDFEFEMKQK